MSVKVQINGEWKEVATDEGDEVSYEQIVQAADLPGGRNQVYRVEYTGAIGPGGILIDGILREGGRVKVKDETTTFTITPSSQT